MKKIMIILSIEVVALPMASCTVPSPPTSIETPADVTTIDERGLLGAELAYKAARSIVEVGVDAGVIRGQRAAELASADRRVFAILQEARRAYELGNSQSLGELVDRALAAIESFRAAAARRND